MKMASTMQPTPIVSRPPEGGVVSRLEVPTRKSVHNARDFQAELRECIRHSPYRCASGENWNRAQHEQALRGLLDYVQSCAHPFQKEVVKDFLRMVESDIFHRKYKKGSTQKETTVRGKRRRDSKRDDDCRGNSPLLYELLQDFVISSEVTEDVLKEHIKPNFIYSLVDLFDTENAEERQILKTILHRLYGKAMFLRKLIRRAISFVFLSAIHETERFNGMAELLEIYGSIINGFSHPLKQENVKFLEQCLIPLHKVEYHMEYHSYLAYCVTKYVEKDQAMAQPIILGMVRYWPVTNTAKEVLYLNELEEILELTSPETFNKVCRPLLTTLVKSMCSQHFQVAQRALYLWNNGHIVNLISSARKEALPVILEPLYLNCESHWNSVVQSLTFNVLKLLMEMDPHTFDKVTGSSLKGHKSLSSSKNAKIDPNSR